MNARAAGSAPAPDERPGRLREPAGAAGPADLYVREGGGVSRVDVDEPFDAVVLAGGRARRLGGADKPGARVGGRSLIAWVADAVAAARRLVIVGPPRPELPSALAVREEPPGSGPVPALRAGLAALTAEPDPSAAAAPAAGSTEAAGPAVPWVVVLAADLPFLRVADVAELRRAAREQGSGAVLVDDDGRAQWLAGCWRAEPLRDALAAYSGASLRGLLGPLEPAAVALPGGERPPWYDCDSPAELERARLTLKE